MFKITFLSSTLPLTKTIRADGSKSCYPNTKNFTSQEIAINTLDDLYRHTLSMATSDAKPCLLKGNLSKQLVKESRKGMMPPNTHTNWVCFDLDGAPFSNPDEFMRAIGLPTTSYIVQFSSSAGLTQSKTLNCHIFVVLSKAISPQALKAWLMHLNLHTPVLEKAITLSDHKAALHWSLDISTCQNDKLIYIATPIFIEPAKDPMPASKRIQLIKRPDPTLDVTTICLKPIESLRKEKLLKRDQLREQQGLPALKTKSRMVDGEFVQPNVGEQTYEIVEEDDEFIRLNLAGGNSSAYYIIKTKPELIYNFKGEDAVYTKEVTPDLYKHLLSTTREAIYTPSTTGDVILAVRDKRTSQYWKGTWNEQIKHLELYITDSKDKLHDFLQGHGVPPPPYIPEWEVSFNPQSETIVDTDKHIINTFVPTRLMLKQGTVKTPQRQLPYPTIQKFLDHAVGTGPIQEHFLNWLAVILQHKIKTKTAWILHGTFGTGKGVLINTILRQIFENYLMGISADDLNGEFNAWAEHSLIVFIDEIEIDMFEKRATEGKLRRMVTDSPQPIRRMRTDTYDAPSYTNFIFASNKSQPVRIPQHDRRYNVGQYQPIRLISTHKEVTETIPSEVPAFANYLITRKANIDQAAQVLHTEDRAAIQALSITSIEEIANHILNGNLEALIEHRPDQNLLRNHGLNDPIAEAYNALLQRIVSNLSRTHNTSTLSRDDMRIIFQHTIGKVPEGSNKFTMFLKHHGIVTKRIKCDGVATYGTHVEWQLAPSQLVEYREEFKAKIIPFKVTN